MATTTSSDQAAFVREVGRAWWLLAIFAVITFVFGVILTFKPSSSVHTIAVLIGIWLFILGIVRLIQAIGASGERVGLVVVGLLSILIGLILLRHTTTTIDVLGFVVGVFWTIGGVAQLFSAFGDRDGVNWWSALLGLISTVVGILCLVYPSLSLSIICVIVGLGLILYGVVEFIASLQIRKLKEA
jgi:uncharacterized membrane protein HdeD (DUF308 family)